MLRSLTNNQILKSVMTDAFLKSVEEKLVPAIEEKLGSSDIFMYKDLLKAPLLIDGRWHYPMTVLSDGAPHTQWISWTVTAADFKDKNPYALLGGSDIDFTLCDIPASLKDKFSDYVGCFGEVGIEISVEAVARDITFLSGRYSQRFVDEMSRQITAKMEELMSCEGLAASQLSLLLTFAPESYFEHTSENVTYRRLLLIDKGAAPRDLWVKWTRTNSAVGYSVSDAPADGDIEFELGEDVPQKIREKEYRFLLREGRDKYQSAMGRKNVTEWREIIRRAIKRGDLQKITVPVEEIVFEDDLSAKLKSVLGEGYKAEPMESALDEAPMGEDYIKALEIAKGFVNAEAKDENEDASEIIFPDGDSGLQIFDLVEETVEDTTEEGVADIFELPALNISEEDEPEAPIVETPAPEVEKAPEIIEVPAAPAVAEVVTVRSEPKVTVISNLGEVSMKQSGTRSDELREAEARAAELGIRLEYEKQMRERLEAEVERLRRSEQSLIEENNRLRVTIKTEEERYRAAEEGFKLEIARLTAQNEVLERSEERQKERLAAAARDAVERQKLLEDEKRHIAEENARLAREKEKERALASEPAVAPAVEEVKTPETEITPAPKAEGASATDKYTYVSKNVKLLFRRPVDPNITGRIYEIIKATIEYFGKEKINLRIKASVPDSETVNLAFTSIPMEEMQLLSSIIQVLGSSGLGIAKAIVE